MVTELSSAPEGVGFELEGGAYAGKASGNINMKILGLNVQFNGLLTGYSAHLGLNGELKFPDAQEGISIGGISFGANAGFGGGFGGKLTITY